MDFAAFVNSDLRDENRGGSESEDAEPLGISRFPQRAESDHSCTQQRRSLHITIDVGNRDTKTLIRNREFGITAVTRVAGELSGVAKILLASHDPFSIVPWNAEESGRRTVRPADLPRHLSRSRFAAIMANTSPLE